MRGVRWFPAALSALLLAVAGCGGSHASGPTAAAAAAGGAGGPCQAEVRRGVLPVWARTGFSDPRPRMPHTLGRSGSIAAVIFGDPLLSPPSKRRSNKILWVSGAAANPGSVLRISAQRMRGRRRIRQPVRRALPGAPGPSIIDLPAAGCWRLTLRWSGRSDVLDLRYAANG
jgi:hypothetical protein